MEHSVYDMGGTSVWTCWITVHIPETIFVKKENILKKYFSNKAMSYCFYFHKVTKDMYKCWNLLDKVVLIIFIIIN